MKPLKVVTSFVDALVLLDRFPAERVPSFEEDPPTATPSSSQRPKPRPKVLPASQSVSRKSTPKSEIEIDEDDDDDDEDERPRKKGKGRAVTIRVGTKRPRQDSPPEVGSQPRRAQKQGRTLAGGLDLGDEEVDEDSLVDTKVLPQVRGQVRNRSTLLLNQLILS